MTGPVFPNGPKTPRRYPKGSVLDQLDSEGHSNVVDAYVAMPKNGPKDFRDEKESKRLYPDNPTGSHGPGQEGMLGR